MPLFSKFSKRRMKPFSLVLFGLGLLKNSVLYASYRKLGFPKILPKFARISITNKCDSRCKTCNIWSYYKRYPEKSKEEMTFEEFKKFVDNNLFLEEIILTGGQPTLHPDIVDMWLYLDSKGYRTGGPTNAVNLKRITSVHKKFLENASGKNTHSIVISVDGIGKEHEKIRGIKGEFKNILKLIKWTQEKQQEFPFLGLSISHNITPTNYKTFPEFVDYFVNLGFKPQQISFRPTQALQRYKLLNTHETIHATKNKAIIGDILNVIKRVTIKYKELNDFYVKGLPNYYANPKKQVIPCYASFSIIFTDTFWNVYPCLAMEDAPIGNLRKTQFKLKPLWRGEKIKKIHKIIKGNQCPNCWIRCYSSYSMFSSPTKILRLAIENRNRLLK